jgi:hypothetical protein
MDRLDESEFHNIQEATPLGDKSNYKRAKKIDLLGSSNISLTNSMLASGSKMKIQLHHESNISINSNKFTKGVPEKHLYSIIPFEYKCPAAAATAGKDTIEYKMPNPSTLMKANSEIVLEKKDNGSLQIEMNNKNEDKNILVTENYCKENEEAKNNNLNTPPSKKSAKKDLDHK